MSPPVPKGSFAGALGVPQFMPGSYREFRRRLRWRRAHRSVAEPADIVGSVANYLARHDWQRGQPVLLPAAIAQDSADAVLRRLDGGISERRTLEAWARDGVAPRCAAATSHPIRSALLMLEEKDATARGAATGSRARTSTC